MTEFIVRKSHGTRWGVWRRTAGSSDALLVNFSKYETAVSFALRRMEQLAKRPESAA